MENGNILMSIEKTGKKICVISANCQGAYIKALLCSHKEFSNDFQVLYYVNYKKEVVPKEVLKKTEILIYQPLNEKWGEHSEKYLLENVFQNSFKIKISYLTFPIYWPFFCHDPRNVSNENYPFGQFPYGDKFVLDLLRKNVEKEKILEKIKSREILTKINLRKVIEDYINFQKRLESKRDQKLLDFIISNYKKYKLFETYNHPSEILALYQVNDILRILGYRSLKDEEKPNIKNCLELFQQPINPYIAESLGLEFEADWNTKYKIWNKPMTTMEYYRAYVYWDITSIGTPRETSCNIKLSENMHNNVINSNTFKIKDINIYKKTAIGKQIVFIHIPKTGGMSIHKMLSRAMFNTDNYMHYNSLLNLIKDSNRRLYPLVSGHFFFDVYKILSKDIIMFTFLRNPITRIISAYEFMKAHPEVWLGKFAQETLTNFLTKDFVRRSVCNLQTKLLGLEINFQTYYSQLINKKITKEEYYNLINSITYLEVTERELERAKQNLEKLFFVGFTETLSSDVKRLFSKLGLNCEEILHENRTPDYVRNRENYSKDEIALIEEYNKYDIELYNYALKIFGVS